MYHWQTHVDTLLTVHSKKKTTTNKHLVNATNGKNDN